MRTHLFLFCIRILEEGVNVLFFYLCFELAHLTMNIIIIIRRLNT